ncbi:hypothetical protein L3X38_018532 [Prunus dulcis]|uniref:Integrase catalytic domain-containing protein n=1 Tax=Prunus dulcis TaxID=3755 RepID=A0AAD4W980_PRUDU|nr:hypothetical protein L3X38_018532 [Prunus dulcis]
MLHSSQIVCSPDSSSICSACLGGKMSRLPFPVSSDRVVHPFHKLHSDIWGPSPVVSIEDYRYFVLFVDDYTIFIWMFPLINKSAVYSTFVKFHAFISTQCSASIKILQSDGGGEYQSHLFKQFLTSKGILHQVSCPYTPQQNGLVERKNRHIIETAVTLMTAAALPLNFWSHACLHASFLINRMPYRTLGFCSPYPKLCQTPPELQSLWVFGSAVFPYLRPYNDNKLQPRTCQCIFLGYANGYKGVICYNSHSGRLFLSRHVVHDETVFPFKQMHSTHTSRSFPVPSSPLLLLVVLSTAPTPTTDSDTIPLQSSIPPSLHTSLQDSTSSATPPCPSTMLPVLTDAQLQQASPSTSVTSQSGLVQSVHPMTTRLKDGTISRKHYSNVAHYTQSVNHSFSGVTCIAHITDTSEPSHFRLAASQPHWQQAMQEEFDALTVQGTWVLVPPPPNKNIVGSKWIYKVKKNPDGSVSRYKALLVA